MLHTLDIAYLIYLVDRAPSKYSRRKELQEELGHIWDSIEDRPIGGVIRFPITTTFDVQNIPYQDTPFGPIEKP